MLANQLRRAPSIGETLGFLPASAWELRVRRAALRLARLPVLDRYVAALVASKPTVLAVRS